MAMQLGLENKKQLRLLIALFAVIVLVGGVEIYKELFSSPSTPRPVPAPVAAPSKLAQNASAQAEGPAAQKLSNAGIDPTLHTEKLLVTENIPYAGSGRNIFFAGIEPAAIEKPIKSPRATQAALRPTGPPPPPAPPKPPMIDLKFFGYTVLHDKSLQAFLVHGEDIFMARTGEIINHRYRVGIIHATSVEITDLPYNNTQTLPLMAF